LATNLVNITTNAIKSSTPPNINEAKKTPFWTRKLIKLKQQLKPSRKVMKRLDTTDNDRQGSKNIGKSSSNMKKKFTTPKIPGVSL